IEVAFARRGQPLQSSPVLAVEPAGVEVEGGGEEVLLRPDDPQPALAVERERWTPDVAGHARHRVPRTPTSRRGVAAGEPQLIAAPGVAGVDHPDVSAIGGI